MEFLSTALGQGYMNLCPIPSTSCELTKFEVAMSSSLGGDVFSRKYII